MFIWMECISEARLGWTLLECGCFGGYGGE